MKEDIKKEKIVIETHEYDNFLDRKNTDNTPNTLMGFLEEDAVVENEDSWEQHYHGMPEYVNSNQGACHQIRINFLNEEDIEEFEKLIKQKITKKTKSLWFPKMEKDERSLFRWEVSEEKE